MQKIYIDKIASAIVFFLRSRAQTKKTFSIDIDEGFKNYLVQNYNINHRNYLIAGGLAGRHRLRRYFRHHTEEYIVTITSFEIIGKSVSTEPKVQVICFWSAIFKRPKG